MIDFIITVLNMAPNWTFGLLGVALVRVVVGSLLFLAGWSLYQQGLAKSPRLLGIAKTPRLAEENLDPEQFSRSISSKTIRQIVFAILLIAADGFFLPIAFLAATWHVLVEDNNAWGMLTESDGMSAFLTAGMCFGINIFLLRRETERNEKESAELKSAQDKIQDAFALPAQTDDKYLKDDVSPPSGQPNDPILAERKASLGRRLCNVLFVLQWALLYLAPIGIHLYWGAVSILNLVKRAWFRSFQRSIFDQLPKRS
jgi:hypothetical protein